MTGTMNPKQILEQFEVEENQGTLKSSHTKNPTLCTDIRRSGEACGICGSFNVVAQGVRYCITCGLEVEYLGEYSGYWWNNDELSPICDCPAIENTNHWKSSPRKKYNIAKCLDCGAVNSSKLCPNCGSRKGFVTGTWKHWDGRVKCSSCGFTIDDPISCSIGAKPNKAEGKQGTRKAKEKAKKHMSRRQKKRFDAKNKPHPNKIGYL